MAVTESDSRGRFVGDLRRTVLLGKYMSVWGMPEYRVVSRRDGEQVEVYYFPAGETEPVSRFATVGVSGLRREGGALSDYEFFMALPADLGGASMQDVCGLILDVMAYSISEVRSLHVGTVIPESKLVPKAWKATGLLIDEPRAEPEEVEKSEFGSETIKLYWIAPIYGDEYRLIKDAGLEEFDRRCQRSGWSLSDPRRPSVV